MQGVASIVAHENIRGETIMIQRKVFNLSALLGAGMLLASCTTTQPPAPSRLRASRARARP